MEISWKIGWSNGRVRFDQHGWDTGRRLDLSRSRPASTRVTWRCVAREDFLLDDGNEPLAVGLSGKCLTPLLLICRHK